MAAHLGPQRGHTLQQLPGVVPRAAYMDILPLRSQVSDALRRAGLEATTGQDHGPSVNVHHALGGLRSYPLDAPFSRSQEVQPQRVVDHANAAPLGSAKQSLCQARAAIPELDHGARWKVNATALT